MSQDFNTEAGEDFSGETRKIIKVVIDQEAARDFLKKLNAPTPDAADLDEIHLVIQK